MGQQASSALGPCVVRSKQGQADHVCLKRVEALLNDPEKLEQECDFHFRRTGLDAHGDLRRVELRRLLWTFAHSLGSKELTWEAIEAAAVVGTVEPHVPVVTKDEFFRCVLKTVHLVAAELRRRVAEAEEGAPGRPSSQPAAEPAGGPRALPLFAPAPGGSPLETAPISGMTVMVLNNEGGFDPQRLFVDRGLLVLSDPGEAEQTVAQRLFGADGRSAFDLSLLELVANGQEVLRTPLVPLLPAFVLRGEALERLMVLNFPGDEALCLWLASVEDSELCRDAVLAEAGARGSRTPGGR